jgi:hypothetical protein
LTKPHPKTPPSPQTPKIYYTSPHKKYETSYYVITHLRTKHLPKHLPARKHRTIIKYLPFFCQNQLNDNSTWSSQAETPKKTSPIYRPDVVDFAGPDEGEKAEEKPEEKAEDPAADAAAADAPADPGRE